MQLAVKKSTALVATAAVIGFSSLFASAAPANATPVGCSHGATPLANNVCELRLTEVGATTFTPSVEMSQLEVLLVGGGGNGSADQGYGGGGGGGGGQVKVVGFGGDTSTPINLVVGDSGQPSSATQGVTVAQALPGTAGSSNAGSGTGTSGGTSGSGFVGTTNSGGGAGAIPTDVYNGGAPATVASVAPVGSRFSDDSSCYGEGGGFGVFGGTYGTATCGGGVAVAGPTSVAAVLPTPNSGGGGAGGSNSAVALRAGASGIVVLRWVSMEVTVTFAGKGHGASVAPQTFARGGIATKPADLTADGFVFNGWFSDEALTTPADFSAAVTASTTFFASWTAVPPVTMVTVTFSDGHGGVTTQTIPAGGKAAKPADPTAAGFTFNGWFTDAALTVPADFSAPFSASTTLYASWSAVATPTAAPTPVPAPVSPAASPVAPALASTGATIDPAAVPVGVAALGLGLGLLALGKRRSRKTN